MTIFKTTKVANDLLREAHARKMEELLEEWMKENGYVWGCGQEITKDSIFWKMRDIILKKEKEKDKE